MREINSLTHRVSNLRAKSLHLIGVQDVENPRCCRQNLPLEESSPLVIAAEAGEIDSALEAWSRSLPNEWRFTDAQRYQDGFPVHTHASHAHAAVWIQYRALRLITNSVRMRALRALPPNLTQDDFVQIEYTACLLNTEVLTKDMCSGVSSLFSTPTTSHQAGSESWSIKVGDCAMGSAFEILPKLAHLISWSLFVAVRTEHAPARMKEWLKARLRTVVVVLGNAMLQDAIQNEDFIF